VGRAVMWSRERLEIAKVLVLLAIAGAIVAAAVIGYKIYRQDYTVTIRDDGQATAQVVSATLYGRSDLRVSRLSGTVQGVGRSSTLWGWLPASQVVKAPFTVDYFVSLQQLKMNDFRYDADRRVLFVDVPAPVPDRPNVDLANTTLNDTKGLFVTRGQMAQMSRQVAASAGAAARERALSPEHMQRARAYAREALEKFFEGGLRAARLNVRVEVRFPDEPRGGVQMDRSTPLSEIYAKAG
jgi:hypothetical protein